MLCVRCEVTVHSPLRAVEGPPPPPQISPAPSPLSRTLYHWAPMLMRLTVDCESDGCMAGAGRGCMVVNQVAPLSG